MPFLYSVLLHFTEQKDLLSQVRSAVTVTSSNDAVEAERSALSDICEMVSDHEGIERGREGGMEGGST